MRVLPYEGFRNPITLEKSFEMTTVEKIKELTELLSVDAGKFYNGNKSAGTRARKSAQELKALLQQFRGEILEGKKKDA